MSWDGNNPDSNSNPFPVESLVEGIQTNVDETATFCAEFNSRPKDRRCCRNIRDCYEPLKAELTAVKLSSAIGQININQACNKIHRELNTLETCFNDTLDNCDQYVSLNVSNKFEAHVELLYYTYGTHCGSVPPPTTTLTPPPQTTMYQTPKPNIPSTKAPSTTTKAPPTTTSSTTTSTTQKTTTSSTERTATTAKATTTTEKITSTDITTASQIPSTETTEAALTTEPHKPDKPPTEKPKPPGTKPPPKRTPPTKKPTAKPTPLNTTRKPPKNHHTPTTDKTSVTSEGINSNGTQSNMSGNGEVPKGSNDTTIMAISAVVAVLIFVAILVICFMLRRKYKQQKENNTSGGSTASTKQFLWRWLHSSKSQKTENTDDEIYAEIDDGFMEAVYKCGQDPEPPKIRERIGSNTQNNLCYGSSADDVISSRVSPPILPQNKLFSSRFSDAKSQEINYHLPHERSHDEMVTSFQMDQSPKTKLDGGQNNPVFVLSNQKAFVISRPTFTDLRQNELATDNYVKIDVKTPEFKDEPIYAVPNEGNDLYDKAFLDAPKLIKPTPENPYNSLRLYQNMKETKANKIKGRASITDCSENYESVYENQDSLMEY